MVRSGCSNFVIASGGQVTWLARTYAAAVALTAILKAVALVRHRRLRPGPRAYRTLTLRAGAREWPVGLVAAGALVAIPLVALLASLDPPTLIGIGLIGGVTLLL